MSTKRLSVVLLLLLLAGGCFIRYGKPAMSSKANKADTKWVEYISEKGRFSATMPEGVVETLDQKEPVTTALGLVPDPENLECKVVYRNLSRKVEEDIQKWKDEFLIESKVKKQDTPLTELKSDIYPDVKAYEITYEGEFGKKYVTRAYAVKPRLGTITRFYELTIGGPNFDPAASKEKHDFFSSFKIQEPEPGLSVFQATDPKRHVERHNLPVPQKYAFMLPGAETTPFEDEQSVDFEWATKTSLHLVSYSDFRTQDPNADHRFNLWKERWFTNYQVDRDSVKEKKISLVTPGRGWKYDGLRVEGKTTDDLLFMASIYWVIHFPDVEVVIDEDDTIHVVDPQDKYDISTSHRRLFFLLYVGPAKTAAASPESKPADDPAAKEGEGDAPKNEIDQFLASYAVNDVPWKAPDWKPITDDPGRYSVTLPCTVPTPGNVLDPRPTLRDEGPWRYRELRKRNYYYSVAYQDSPKSIRQTLESWRNNFVKSRGIEKENILKEGELPKKKMDQGEYPGYYLEYELMENSQKSRYSAQAWLVEPFRSDETRLYQLVSGGKNVKEERVKKFLDSFKFQEPPPLIWEKYVDTGRAYDVLLPFRDGKDYESKKPTLKLPYKLNNITYHVTYRDMPPASLIEWKDQEVLKPLLDAWDQDQKQGKIYDKPDIKRFNDKIKLKNLYEGLQLEYHDYGKGYIVTRGYLVPLPTGRTRFFQITITNVNPQIHTLEMQKFLDEFNLLED